MSFSQLRVSSDILKGLKDFNIVTPSPLQKKIINSMKDGGDILINVSEEIEPETGYLVPVLDQIAKQDRRQGTKAIILTRHSARAAQLDEWIRGVGSHAGIECARIEEEGDRENQKSALSAGPVIIVATPARLAGLMEENRVIFREVKYFILDQAEEIESWEQVDVINKRIIGKCSHLATVGSSENVNDEKFDSFLHEPKILGMPKQAAKTVVEEAETVDDEKPATKESAESTSEQNDQIPPDLSQYYIKVPPRMKISTLMAHLEATPADTVLIFTASRRTADRLYRVFRKSNKRAVSVHDSLDEDTFKERFDRFNSGNVQHLIAGETSASSLPIKEVTQVINYDVPEEVAEYKMRAELVGDGKATRIVSLVSQQDQSDIHEIIEGLGYAPVEIPLPEGVKDKKGKSKSKGSEKEQKKGQSKNGEKRQAPKTKKPPSKTPRNVRSSRPEKKQRRGGRPSTENEPMELPRPSYDKLSGGRSGKKKENKGLVGFFRKLFS